MVTTLPSASIFPLPSPSVSDRGGLHIFPFPRRLEITQFSPASSSIFTLHFSTLPRSWSRWSDAASAVWSGLEEVQLPGDQLEDDAPSSIELLPITSEEQFDRIIAEAQKLEESLIILWMADWCRKCIYLKPKLEKLAADYHPRNASKVAAKKHNSLQQLMILCALEIWSTGPLSIHQLLARILAHTALPPHPLYPEAIVERAHSKINDGHFAAAIRMLSSCGVTQLDAVTHQTLEEKHPVDL